MRRQVTIGLLALVVLGLAAGAPRASADVPINVFGFLPSNHQAGSHPDLQIAFSLKSSPTQLEEEGVNTPCDCQNARFLTVHAPRGVGGNPHATPQCTSSQFASQRCPVDSQVGVIEVEVGTIPFLNPVYNLVPREGEAGLLGFVPKAT